MRWFAVTAGGVAVAAWTYLALLHGRFWSVRDGVSHADDRASDGVTAWKEAALGSAEFTHRAVVVAVVPARDEADAIAHSVSSLLAQDEIAHVVLVDDASSDGTAQVARAEAERSGSAERLTVIRGRALPDGRSGKVWAMSQGIERAMTFNPDYLLLTDADIVHQRGSVDALVKVARRHKRDLVSFMAKLHCESTAERLLIPAFVFFFFKLYPPLWIADPRRSSAGAAGGCMLVMPEALARAGGIESIRGEVIDDCALARAVKRSGGSVELRLSDLVRSERGYGAGDIGRMISRTAFSQLRHSGLVLAGSVAGLALLYSAPPLLVVSGDRAGALLGGLAWALMAACYLPMVRFYGLRPEWALTLPAAAIFYMGATVHSAVSFWCGTGGRWKGRVQDPIGPR